MAMRRQSGAQTVELSLTFLTFIVILIGVVELIRALWLWTLLGEATRRGARVAAVCDINDAAIYRETTAIPTGLSYSNISVTYEYCQKQSTPAVPCNPDRVRLTWGAQPSASQATAIRSAEQAYVRVSIVDFQPRFAFLFPWGNRDDQGAAILSPTGDFATVLPTESLGWDPTGGTSRTGAFDLCPP